MTSAAASQTSRTEASHPAMRTVARSTIGLICGLIWLVLLVATKFAPWTVSVGFLAAIYVLGTSE